MTAIALKPLIVALDFADLNSLWALVQKLDAGRCRLKVGKELFTRFGPDLVRQLQDIGFEIFLDLKFHDIPNTVAQAVTAAADLGVWMVNVHASGGCAMMDAAVAALRRSDYSTLLTAVTVLTSLEDADLLQLGVSGNSAEQVQRLARLAHRCGLDGVVCSAQEAPALRSEFPDWILVTPGIRPSGADCADQKRVATPREAMNLGASYLVIGRPISQATYPVLVMDAILESLN